MVDRFVIYDDIQYTKKGWINRNRILQNGTDALFTLPLKKDSDYLNIKDRFLSSELDKHLNKILGRINNNYRKAPHFKEVYPLLESIFRFEQRNLFDYIKYSLERICQFLKIDTPLIVASSLSYDSRLVKENKVLDICKKLEATSYVNPIGGLDLYNSDFFESNAIQLKFQKVKEIEYAQFDHDFVPWLSIIDVMMFNDVGTIKNDYFNRYTLIENEAV